MTGHSWNFRTNPIIELNVISILVSPLFYLIPLGTMLCLLRGMLGKLPLSLVLASACCAGFVVLTILLQYAEALGILRGSFRGLCLLVMVATALGLWLLIRHKANWHIASPALLISISTVLIVYLYTYFVLYHYPTGDLFQDVHSMKGAEELGRFGILSPYVTDSYIPIKQAIAGILVRTFGFDQLVGYWALGPSTMLFKLVVVFAASSIVSSPHHRAVVFVIVSAVVVNGEFSNGILCFFSSLLLMTTTNKWMQRAAGTTEIRNSSLLLLALVAAELFLAFRWTHLAQTYFLIAVAGASQIPFVQLSFEMSPPGGTVTLRKSVDPVLLLILLMTGSMLPMHRSSIILIPIAMGVGWALAVPIPLVLRRYLIVPGVILPLCSLVPVGMAVAQLLNIPTFSNLSDPIVSWTALILGSNPGDDFELGTGLRNALVEWTRTIGLNLALLLAATFLYTTLSRSGRSLWQDQRFSVSWIIGWSLTLLILVGTPFAYRASFYVVLLFSVSLSIALLQIWKSVRSALPFATIVVLLTSGTYLLAAHTLALYRPYLEFVWPITIMFSLLAVMAISAFFCSGRMEYVLLATLAAFALSLDRVGSKFVSLPHSYGRPTSQVHVVAHYTEDDLAVAQALRSFQPDTAVISDLYTMSIVRARTGIGGIVPFSNLDTIATDKRELLQQAIGAARRADRMGYCKAVRQLVDGGASEYWYTIRRINNFKSDYDKPSEIRTLFVFSSKTADWATTIDGERTSYFPNTLPLGEEQIASIAELGPIVANSSGKTIASFITCPAVEESSRDPLLTP
ncbi:hypothetical protein [Bradyrhizobium sp. UFLA05-112]